MSDRERRLDRLEAVASGGRCAVRADWPPTRVIDENDPHERPHRPGGPDACPSCGWEVPVIRVVYVDDRRPLTGQPLTPRDAP